MSLSLKLFFEFLEVKEEFVLATIEEESVMNDQGVLVFGILIFLNGSRISSGFYFSQYLGVQEVDL